MHEGCETVSVVLPVTDPRVARIVVFPVEDAAANPEGLIEPTRFEEDDQDTALVDCLMVPSLYWSTAVNCWKAPTGWEGLAGVTVIELRTGTTAVTVIGPIIAL